MAKQATKAVGATDDPAASADAASGPDLHHYEFVFDPYSRQPAYKHCAVRVCRDSDAPA